MLRTALFRCCLGIHTQALDNTVQMNRADICKLLMNPQKRQVLSGPRYRHQIRDVTLGRMTSQEGVMVGVTLGGSINCTAAYGRDLLANRCREPDGTSDTPSSDTEKDEAVIKAVPASKGNEIVTLASVCKMPPFARRYAPRIRTGRWP